MTEKFIKRSKERFGDMFDYSKTKYIAYKKEITLICKKHGEFKTTPDSHLSKHSLYGCCPSCSRICSTKNNEDKTERFILKAKAKFGDKFDYSETHYTLTKSPVVITCKKHGDFIVKPDYFLDSACGCQQCGKEQNMLENLRRKEKTALEFPVISSKIYNNKYDYSKVEYVDDVTPVIIICPKHGEFLASPNKHKWRGKECPVCSKNKSGKSFYENLTEAYCLKNNIPFSSQFIINDEFTKNKPFDFFFEKLNLIFEINGSQHEEKRWTMTDADLEKRKNIDSEKKRIALEKGYNFLIIRKPSITNIFKIFKLLQLETEISFLEKIKEIENDKILFFKNN